MSKKIATRHAYGEALAEIGIDPNIIVLDADVSSCTMSCMFKDKYPERFHNMGIAEANMVGTAAGLATAGYHPFVHTFSMFLAGRAYEQIRNSIAYPNLNVKLVGTHAGLSVGEDGATHQCLEDLALMRVIPNMCVICPSDANETQSAVRALSQYTGPAYLRLGRLPVKTVTDYKGYNFEIGKSVCLREGNDATIIATGLMVQEAVKVSDMLKEKNLSVRVLDMHTIKPLDKAAVIRAAQETNLIITVEEHNVIGGLGGAVCEILSQNHPTRTINIGISDVFGRSGNALALLENYGLNAETIYTKILTELEK